MYILITQILSFEDCGHTYLLLRYSEYIGLHECLKYLFKTAVKDILVMAAYIIRGGNSMDEIDAWQARNYFPDHDKLLNSQSASRIFSIIKYEQRTVLFNGYSEPFCTTFPVFWGPVF